VITGRDAGVRDDRTRQVRIDQEVLAERLRRTDAVAPGQRSERSRSADLTS
jgi:hypothetical protein